MAREIWVADCETDPFAPGRVDIKPFLWGAYNGSEYHEFKSTEKFLDFMTEKQAICYAHNGGKFDWFFIADKIANFEPIMVIGGRLAKFTIGDCEFRDSYSILPFPLSAYKKDKIDYSIFEKGTRDIYANSVLIRDYLRSDCVYLYDLVSAFINRFGINLTIAGTALKTWAKQAKQKIPSTSREFYQNFKPFYYGGRVECFESGIIKRDFQVVDIRSAYPEAMLHDHPWGDTVLTDSDLPDDPDKIQRSFITLRAISTGALPLRAPDKSLFFPNDNIIREYKITGWEYLAALETNTLKVVEILEVQSMLEKINYRDFIIGHYKERLEAKKNGDKTTDIFCKLIMNALYGKFGANPDEYDEYSIVDGEFIEQSLIAGYSHAGKISDRAIIAKPLDDVKKRFYNVATAASITGYVRAKLWRAICASDGVMYCDTDCIVADSPRVDIGTNLGQWELEANCNYAAIGGKKLYAFRRDDRSWKTRSKGVRLNRGQIRKIAKGVPVVHIPIIPTFSLKRGIVLTPRKISPTI